jgi:hypothetical protein
METLLKFATNSAIRTQVLENDVCFIHTIQRDHYNYKTNVTYNMIITNHIIFAGAFSVFPAQGEQDELHLIQLLFAGGVVDSLISAVLVGQHELHLIQLL